MNKREQSIFTLSKEIFLKDLGYKHNPCKPSKKFFETLSGRFLIWIGIGIYLALALGIELLFKTFEFSHLFAFSIAWVSSLLFVLWDKVRKNLLTWSGLDEKPPNTTLFGISIPLALLLSIYIVLSYAKVSSSSNPELNTPLLEYIPAVLGFSCPVISATLAGLAISSANYSKISMQGRFDMLRAGHKLILATCFFVLFTVIFSLLTLFEKNFGQVNPNHLAWDRYAIIGGTLFWGAAFSLVLGPFFFIQGSGTLLTRLVKLRKLE
jgi:hypothetical protein